MENKIDINFKDENLEIKLFDNNDNFIVDIKTTMQLYNVRCQIKEKKLLNENEYYYLKLNNIKYKIDYCGRLERKSFKIKEFSVLVNYLERLAW